MSFQDAKKRSVDAWRWAARHSAQIVIGLITIYAVYALRDTTKHELIPATLFTGFAALCSVQALTYTREKFRLDLFEKRLDYYHNLLEYINEAKLYADYWYKEEDKNVPPDLTKVAGNSILGLQSVTVRMLFDKDIHVLVSQLRDEYMDRWMATFHRSSGKQYAPKVSGEFLHYRIDGAELDRYFGRYVYFGNYTRDDR